MKPKTKYPSLETALLIALVTAIIVLNYIFS
ncbi:Uncharacterised protein [Myroides odoratus]|uniref:Uncharacterized protein n=1 Tax=Myroides odoratus TaxID=256 RepID=A0A378RMU4_MYROD|nr:Uncharacterised protein [Myroides odoratus]